MTDQTTPATCPYCPHPAHRPGVECGGGVDHGPKHWHRCLCLNLVNAEGSCHPLMDCQGGKLGYSDIWYLQRGHSLSSADGPVTPDVLKTAAVPSAVPALATSAGARLDPARKAAAARRAALEEAIWDAGAGSLSQDDVDRILAAVLAVLPASVDRATVLNEAERTMLTYALDQAQERIWSEDGFTDEDQAAVTSLRRLAVEARDGQTTQGCCDVEFEGGGTCAKPAGHRPPGSDDPHVPAVVPGGAGEEPEHETREAGADGAGEPAELRTLPREVRRLVHAVDRMRSDWAEAPENGPERRELWTEVHAACDAVWNRAAGPVGGAQQPKEA